MASAGCTFLSTICVNPAAIESRETITATTVATPTTVTIEAPARWGMARTFIAVTAQICANKFTAVSRSPAGQGVDHLEPHGADGWWQPADQGKRDREREAGKHQRTRLHVEADGPARDREQQGGEAEPHRRRDNAEDQRFGEDQPHQAA